MPIDDWMPVLRDNIASVDGIKQAHKYDELPGTLSVFPSAIILPIYGDAEYSVGGPIKSYHYVQITVFVANQILPQANSIAVPFIEKVRNKLAGDITLNNTVDHCLPVGLGEHFYEGPGSVTYGDKVHMGIIFRVVVKEDESGTFTVSA
jgi:hypothetical protein